VILEIREEFSKLVENPFLKQGQLPYPKIIFSEAKPFGRNRIGVTWIFPDWKSHQSSGDIFAE
jgi:hypothetical protein